MMNLTVRNSYAIQAQIAPEYQKLVFDAYDHGSTKAKRLIDLVTNYNYSYKHPDDLISEAREIDDLLAEVIGMKQPA